MPDNELADAGLPATVTNDPMYRLARGLAVLGGLILVMLALITVASIVGRNLLSAAVPGDYELVEYGAGLAAALFLPLAQIELVHPRITIFSDRFNLTARRMLDGLALIIAAGLSLGLALQLGRGAWDAFRFNDQSMILQLPSWVGIAVLAAALCLAAVLAAFRLVRPAPDMS
ncbi:MAG: TRAP transporter small permease subunit [Pseudomonadota bacterium]